VAEPARLARAREAVGAARAQSGFTMQVGVADVLFRQVRIHGFWCAPPAGNMGPAGSMQAQCSASLHEHSESVFWVSSRFGEWLSVLSITALHRPYGVQCSASALHPICVKAAEP